jgi:DNA polymerase
MSIVSLTKAIFEHAIMNPAFPDIEFEVVDHTAKINQRGVRVDPARVEKLVGTLVRRRESELESFARRFAFDTSNINNVSKTLEFIACTFKTRMESLDRKGDDFRRATDRGGELVQFLLGRARLQALSRAIKHATAYSLILGGRVCGVLKCYGAHTGRFSAGSRDAEGVNLHGLSKGSKALGLPELGLERTILVPDDGWFFRSADLSTIEARVVALLAGESDLLGRFSRADEDVYCWFAGLIFPGVEITKGGPNSHLRALGKEAMIGCCFGMGIVTLTKLVRTKQIPCTDADIQRAYDTFQESFPYIKGLRGALFNAFQDAAADTATKLAGCQFYCADVEGPSAPTVAIELPTGRTLFYRSVRFETEVTAYGIRPATWFAPSFGGRGKSSSSRQHYKRRRFADGVVRDRLTPQVVIENVAQAIARDIMVHQVLELERRGLQVAWHTHDEIVIACPACTCGDACASSCTWTVAGQELASIMSSVPSTLPQLSELPLSCELNPNVRETYAS